MRKRNGKWYARISIPNNGRRIDKQISLKTKSRTIARTRLLIVEKYEEDIKSGMELTFPWLNGNKNVSLKSNQLGEAIKDYLKHRQLLNLSQATIDQNRLALTHLKNTLGGKFDIERLDKTSVDRFIRKYNNKHAITTLNMNIRAIKTFFKWLFETERIKSIISIKQLYQDPSVPKYLTEREFQSILDLTDLSDHYKSVFNLYRDLGCRLSEPFRGQLDGNWLIISGTASKTRSYREIELSDEQAHTVIEMKSRLGHNPPRYKIANYSKVFKKACRKVGLTNRFHHLRHTYAIMEYLRTRDIYFVSKKMGHASVVTTEIYTKFNLKKLALDFPSMKEDGTNEN